jgi:hypothetical protein
MMLWKKDIDDPLPQFQLSFWDVEGPGNRRYSSYLGAELSIAVRSHACEEYF